MTYSDASCNSAANRQQLHDAVAILAAMVPEIIGLMIDHPDTPLATLEKTWSIGRQAGLRYVYIGNARSALGSNTFCPACEAVVIERDMYDTRLHSVEGKCPSCGVQIPGVWK